VVQGAEPSTAAAAAAILLGNSQANDLHTLVRSPFIHGGLGTGQTADRMNAVTSHAIRCLKRGYSQ